MAAGMSMSTFDQRESSTPAATIRLSIEIKLFTVLAACAMLGACGSQELRFDNLNWDIQPDPIYRETIVRHSRPKDPIERYDPQEYDPRLERIFVEADAIAERLVGNVPRNDDFGATFWAMKKRVLAQNYQISWHSPAELNRTIEYGDYGQRKLSDTETSKIRAIVIQHLESESVHVTQIQRRFLGDVWAWAKKDDDIYLFVIEGHRDSWEVKNFGIVDY